MPATRPATIPMAIGSRQRPDQAGGAADGDTGGEEARTPAPRTRPRSAGTGARSARPAPVRPPGHPRGRLRTTGTAKPSRTPATVACTPEACTSVHVAAASGSSSHHERTRRCTSTVNTASGDQRTQQRHQGQVGGEEHRDDRDREQVVDDGQGEQERAQRGRQAAADHREHRQGERDVGRGRDRPPRQRPLTGVPIDQDEDHRRDDHSADRGGDRQRRPAGVAQVPGDELPLEFQPGDEEEDRQQPVRGPRPQREVQVQRSRAER